MSEPVAMAERIEPRTERELATALRELDKNRRRLRLCGHDSRPPEDLDGSVAVVSLARLDAITRFHPDDLTISVQAGCPLATLQEAAAEHHLWLPFDPPPASGSARTVGGALAEGAPGALAFSSGEPRDLVLGFTAVLADGMAFKSGARVVKSVAGFDLAKLLVGSRGSLFAVAELHLRLRSRPRASVCLVSAPLGIERGVEILRALRRPPLAFQTLSLLHAGEQQFVVVAEAAGSPAEVAWHQAEIDRQRLQLTVADEPAAAHWRQERLRLAHLVAVPSGACSRGQVQPSKLGALATQLAQLADSELGELAVQGDGRFVAHHADLVSLAAKLAGRAVGRAGPAAPWHGTARDPRAERLATDLCKALDPHGRLFHRNPLAAS
jgi:FAD/FMN-containing dehydrogenase